MTESNTNFLIGEDLEITLSLIESGSFEESPENASMVTETSPEMQNEEYDAHLRTECFKTH